MSTKTEQNWSRVRSLANGALLRVSLEAEADGQIRFFSPEPDRAAEQYDLIARLWPGRDLLSLRCYRQGHEVCYPLPASISEEERLTRKICKARAELHRMEKELRALQRRRVRLLEAAE